MGFFEEFRELSEGSTFAAPAFDHGFVELSNPVCGDLVRVRIQLEQSRVSYYGYQQKGCWPVTGCLELLGQLSQGAMFEQILSFRLDDFLALVRDVPVSKRHAFSLCHRALLAATSQAAHPGDAH
jgi:NifU-like protein involved in Fe-S cluster formation